LELKDRKQTTTKRERRLRAEVDDADHSLQRFQLVVRSVPGRGIEAKHGGVVIRPQVVRVYLQAAPEATNGARVGQIWAVCLVREEK